MSDIPEVIMSKVVNFPIVLTVVDHNEFVDMREKLKDAAGNL
jgi:hypothetical protein